MTTAQEARHKPKDAKVFNELNKGNGIQQVSTGPEGRTTIHDNLLEYNADEKEHNKDKASMREREKRRGVTREQSTSTMGEPEGRWLGRICSGAGEWLGRICSEAGEAVDPDKARHIGQEGKPEINEDVRSWIQAAAYNAKYDIDHNDE